MPLFLSPLSWFLCGASVFSTQAPPPTMVPPPPPSCQAPAPSSAYTSCDAAAAPAPPATQAPSTLPPPPPSASVPPPPAPIPLAQSLPPGLPSGQWVHTAQYGWVWMPYGNTFTHVPTDGGTPTMYVYYPVMGWRWVIAPWLWGCGPMPYFGIYGPVHFGWWGHGCGHWHGFRGVYANHGWGCGIHEHGTWHAPHPSAPTGFPHHPGRSHGGGHFHRGRRH